MSKAIRLFHSFFISLAALFCLSSCITTDLNLGSGLVPTDRNMPIKIAQFDINLGQKYPDSLQTLMSGTAVVGSINTAESGTVTVGTAMTVIPSRDSIRWGGSPVFKSMRLAIPINSCQAMEDNQYAIPQNIYFHKMKIAMDSTGIYANSIKSDDYEKAQCTLSPAVYTADDSLTVMFNEEFALPLFGLDSTVMDSTELFVKKFYGIFMESDAAAPNTGRLNVFNMNGASLVLTFNSENSAGHRRDTSVLFYVGTYASVLKIDQDKLRPECDTTDSVAFYDGLTGIKPVINAAKLRAHIEELAQKEGLEAKAVMVSKAQFDFPFEYPGSNDGFSNWPSNMYLCQRMRDTSGMVYYNPISEIYAEGYDVGAMNRSKMSYCPDAALYIQSLLNAPAEEIDDTYDLWLIPHLEKTTTSSSSSNSYMDYMSYYYYYYYGFDPYGSSSSSVTYYYADNISYNRCPLNGTKAQRHPTLRITYTLLR